MDRKTLIAVAVQLTSMLWVTVPPMIVASTGTVAWLETEKMDPRALFRGDYVILGYRQAQGIVPPEMAERASIEGRPVYVTFTTERPGRFVAVGLEPPRLEAGQVCIVGRVRSWPPAGRSPGGPGEGGDETNAAVDFPQIAQYFVPEGEGRELEARRGENLLARIAVDDDCDAVLLGLEPR